MWAGIVGLCLRTRQWISVPVQLVAGKAWDRGLIGQSGIQQAPWSLFVHWRDQIADAALEVHRVAAEAVVHQERLLVVVIAQEDLRVGGAVRSRGPACVFFAMALGAALLDLQNVVCLEANLFGDFPRICAASWRMFFR